MAILAHVEVDDDGSIKIRNFRDALSDLGVKVGDTQNQINAANRAGATSSKQHADAISQLTAAQRQASADAAKAAQAHAQVTAALQALTAATQAQTAAITQLNAQSAAQTQIATNHSAAMAQMSSTTAQAAVSQTQLATAVTATNTALSNTPPPASTGIIEYLNALSQFATKAAAANDEIKLIAGALTGLSMGLQAGVAATRAEAAALEEITQAARAGVGFTKEMADALELLNAKVQQGIPLTQEEITQLRELTEQYGEANAEALGLASAIDRLIEAESAAAATAEKHARALEILATQLKAGVQATTLQKTALAEVATNIQTNAKFTEEMKRELIALSDALTKTGTLTAAQTQRLRELTVAYRESISATKDETTALQQFNAAAAASAAAFGLIGAGIYQLLENSATLAARIETLGVVTGITAKNAHQSSTEMLLQVEAIKKLGITTTEATDAVLQFARANLNLADASKLARVAQDLAVVAGENSSQTLGRLIHAIQTSETMLLRQVGIVTTNEAIWREYAATLGKTYRELTQTEKQQAFVNKILTEGAKVAGAYEAAMGTAGKQMQSLARFVETAQEKLGKALLPTMALAVTATTELLKVWIALPEPLQAAAAAMLAAAAAAATLTAALSAARFVGLVDIFVKATVAVSNFTIAIRAGYPIWTAASLAFGPWTAAVVALTAAVSIGVGIWVAYSNAAEESIEDLHKQAAASIEAEEAFGKLAEQALKAEKSMSEMRAKGLQPSAAQLEEYRLIAEKLLKIAPQTVQVINAEAREYRILADEVNKVVDAKNREQEADLNKLRTANVTAQQQAQVAEDRLREAQKRLGELQRQQQGGRLPSNDLTMGAAIDPVKELTAQVEQLQKAYDEARTRAKAAGDASREASLRALPAAQRLTFVMREANEVWLEFANKQTGKKAGEGLEAMMRVAKVTSETLEETFKKGPLAVKALTADMEKAWADHLKKMEAARKKQENELKRIDEMIREGRYDLPQFQKANELLNAAGLSVEEYAARVQRARPILEAFAKSTDPAVKSLIGLQKATSYEFGKDYAAQLQVAILANEKFTKSLEETAAANERARLAERRALSQQVGDQRSELLREQAEKEIAIRTELYDQMWEQENLARMSATDRALYEEEKRVNGILRELHKEDDARDRALDRERARVDERTRLAAEELQIMVDRVNAEQELALQMQRNKVASMQEGEAKRKAQIDLMGAEIERALNRQTLEEFRKNELRKIEAHHQASQAILDRTAQTNAEIRDRNVALGRDIRAASDVTKLHIIKNLNDVRRLTVDILKGVASEFLKGLADMATGARSFKDVMSGIWNSLKQVFFNFVDAMIQKWIEGMVKKVFASKAADAAIAASNASTQAAGGATGVGGGGIGLFGKGMSTGQQIFAGAGAGFLAGGITSQYLSGGSRTKGVLSGAGAGAAAGFMVGGPVGAAVGGIVGGITGFFNAEKERKEVQRLRDELIKTSGGIEQLRKDAREAGFDLTKMLNTTSLKEYNKELEKFNKAMEPVQIRKARDELIKASGGLLEFQRQAQLVGYDINNLYNAKSIEEYNANVEILNERLELQQKRLEGLGTAAQGLATMVKGFGMRLTKEVDDILKGLSKEAVDRLDAAFKAAQEKGFAGTRADFLAQQARAHGRDLDPKTADAIRQIARDAQIQFNTLGLVATTTIAAIIRETGSLAEAFAATGESLDALVQMQETWGFEASAAFQKVLDIRKVFTDNEDIITYISGITAAIKGLGQAGRLNSEVLNQMGADLTAQFEELQSRGVSAEDALLALQPSLQALWEAQQKYGIEVDETTQALIDQGIQAGLVGAQQQDINQQMLNVLLLIADALVHDIPDGYKKMIEAARGMGDATASTAQALEQQRQNIAALREELGRAEQEYEQARRAAEEGGAGAEQAMYEAERAVEALQRRIAEAEQAFRDMGGAAWDAGQTAADAMGTAAEGQSPTGVKQVVYRLNEAIALFDAFERQWVDGAAAMEAAAAAVAETVPREYPEADAVTYAAEDPMKDHVPSAGEQTVQAAAVTAPTVTVVVNHDSAVDLDINGTRSSPAEEWESLRPVMMQQFRDNTEQVAAGVAAAVGRYVRRQR